MKNIILLIGILYLNTIVIPSNNKPLLDYKKAYYLAPEEIEQYELIDEQPIDYTAYYKKKYFACAKAGIETLKFYNQHDSGVGLYRTHLIQSKVRKVLTYQVFGITGKQNRNAVQMWTPTAMTIIRKDRWGLCKSVKNKDLAKKYLELVIDKHELPIDRCIVEQLRKIAEK